MNKTKRAIAGIFGAVLAASVTTTVFALERRVDRGAVGMVTMETGLGNDQE